jgi:hypothetical protein
MNTTPHKKRKQEKEVANDDIEQFSSDQPKKKKIKTSKSTVVKNVIVQPIVRKQPLATADSDTVHRLRMEQERARVQQDVPQQKTSPMKQKHRHHHKHEKNDTHSSHRESSRSKRQKDVDNGETYEPVAVRTVPQPRQQQIHHTNVEKEAQTVINFDPQPQSSPVKPYADINIPESQYIEEEQHVDEHAQITSQNRADHSDVYSDFVDSPAGSPIMSPIQSPKATDIDHAEVQDNQFEDSCEPTSVIWLKLYIGGRIINTSAELLTKIPNTLFTKVLCINHTIKGNTLVHFSNL